MSRTCRAIQTSCFRWRVIHVWECEIKRVPAREARLARLYTEITGQYNNKEAEVAIAAEPEGEYGKISGKFTGWGE